MLVAAGCAGEGGTDPTPPPGQVVANSPSATVPPTPGSGPGDTTGSILEEVPPPEPLPLPPYPSGLAAEDTAENAILAAEYFLELVSHVQSTGDVEPLERASVPICATCKRLVDRQVDRKERNAYLVGNHLSIDGAFARRTVDDLAWEVIGEVSGTSGTEVENGKVVRIFPAQTESNFRIGVQLVEDEWMILEFAKGKRDE